VYSLLIGAGRIEMADFSGLSSRVSVYSSNDDYSGATLTNPTIPKAFSGVVHAGVSLGKHVIIGSGSVILPGVVLQEGAAVGALSLVTRNCESFSVYLGVPAKKIKKRKRDLLDLERRLRSQSD
jgi:galactoside O-acetyltransferase